MVNPVAGQQQQIMGFPMQPPLNPFAQRGQRDLMLLNQLSQGFSPVVTAPAPQMRTGFENLPGFNQPGVMGLAMNQFVAPMLQNMMARQGMVPGGLSSQNILDYQAAQQFRQDQNFIMREQSSRDEDSYYQTIRGVQALTGNPFNAPQRAAARRLASTASGLTPSIAPLAPELIDSMAGRTGSAAVMAMRMQQFNRFRTDPVTGLTGYSRESNAAEAGQVFDQMFAPENMASMRGMRAGQVGEMYGEMMRRGMVGTDPRPMRQRVIDATNQAIGNDPANAAQMREELGLRAGEEIDPQNLDADQLDKLRGLESVQGNLRSFNATAVKDSLQGYVEAVTTMREIFGDAGISNAPMSQLIQGLEALSQGTMTQIDPGSLNMMVRTTQQLAQQSGMTIDAAVMMQQQGATTLQKLGVERNFAPQVTQGAMAFGQAATQAGAGANPAWGLENMDFQRQLDQNLRAAAVASPTTNALSALVRADEDFGGFGERRRDTETDAQYQARTTEFERRSQAMSTAVQEGRTEYSFVDENGNTQVANLYDDQSLVQSMLIQQGRNQGLSGEQAAARAQNIMMQRAENRETGFRHDVGNLTRRLQPEEVRRQLLQPAAEGMLQGVEGADVDAASEAFADAALSMDRETATDQDARIDAFVAAIRPHVAQQAGESNENYESRLRGTANLMEGDVNRRIKDPNSQFGSYQDFQNLMVQQSDTTLEDAAIRHRRAELDAGVRDAMTGLTGHGVLANLVTAVQGAGDDPAKATMAQVLGRTFGGVQASEISDRLEGPMNEFQESRDRITDIQRRLSLAKPEDRRGLLQELQAEKDTLKSRADQLRTVAERNGLLEQKGALDAGDLASFDEAEESVRQNRLTSAAILMRPDAGMSDEERLRRGEAAGLLSPEIRDDALLDQLTTDPETGKPIANAAERRAALVAGTADLSEAERLQILEHRQDAIRVTPTEDEVTSAVEGLPENLRNRGDVRRLFAGAIATERRMAKTGVTQADLRSETGGAEIAGMNTAALDTELAEYGVGRDVLSGLGDDEKKRLLVSQRENAAYSSMTADALTGGPEAQEQRREGWEKMSRGQRDAVRKGWQDRFDAVQTIIEDTGGAGFIRRAGGRGLMLRDELMETQEADMRLRRLFGGDAGAAAVLVGGGTVAQQRKFADYVETEIGGDPSRFFDDEGKLRDQYAKGDLAGLSRKDFESREGEGLARLSMLGARDAQIQQEANDKRRAEVISQLRHTVSKKGMGFTLEGGDGDVDLQARKSAARLMGKEDIEDEDVVKTAEAMKRLGGLGEGEPFEAVRKAALSGVETDDISETPGDIGMDLKEFRARVEDYRLVDKHTAAASERARSADLGDPSRSLAAIGGAMGLSTAQLQDLRSDRRLGAKFATGEGQAWAREISGAAEHIQGAAGDKDPSQIFSAIQDVISSRGAGARGDAMNALKKLTGREDVGDLVSAGKMLEHGGMLDILSKGEGRGDIQQALVKALDTLQKSEKTVGDVRPQQIEITGDLNITGNTGSIDATGKGGGK
jgi:hypothetical protein